MRKIVAPFVALVVTSLFLLSPSGESADIYDESADASQVIANAVDQASASGKHVMITWGGDWCGWCQKFHEAVQGSPKLKAFLAKNYVRVTVDSRSNEPLMKKMDVDAPGVPYFTILDGKGKKVTDIRSRFFVVDSRHDPAIVEGVLAKFAPNPAPAQSETAYVKRALALQKLERTEKRLFVKFSTPSCGWCHRLNDFLHEKEIQAILEKDFAFLEIDQATLSDGKVLRAQLAGSQSSGGVPWFAILDKKGTVLTTATGPGGNIGYPAEPEGIVHFMKMIKQSATSISEDEFLLIESRLKVLAKQFGH